MSDEAFTTRNTLLPLSGISEGNFASYAALWRVAYGIGENKGNELIGVYPPLNLVFINNTSRAYFTRRLLSTGAIVAVTAIIDQRFNVPDYRGLMSTFGGRYYAYVQNVGGVPILQIWKNGVLLQSFDLSLAPINFLNVGANGYVVSFSPDGKHILVDDVSTNNYALIVGT